jgi:soluble lytic murein transglycosylase
MSAQPATAQRTRRIPRRPSRAATWRRRLSLVAGLALIVIAVVSLVKPADHAVQEIKLPLRHEDIIRQQAQDKQVDAALIAAVIYTESRFRDQTSQAGAKGLMQLMPATADYIAKKSGGTRFERADLATPQINIAYGTWYLRWLMDRYDERPALALAAYNAGFGHVDKWVAAAGGADNFDPKTDIPFPETRNYVLQVLERRRDYARRYSRELGL